MQPNRKIISERKLLIRQKDVTTITKKDLKLKDRVYRCPHCGAVIDRDLNASLNLSMYKLAQFHKQENANMQDSLYPNLSLWRIISNESSYGKIGFNEEGNKQIFIFLQIFGNGF